MHYEQGHSSAHHPRSNADDRLLRASTGLYDISIRNKALPDAHELAIEHSDCYAVVYVEEPAWQRGDNVSPRLLENCILHALRGRDPMIDEDDEVTQVTFSLTSAREENIARCFSEDLRRFLGGRAVECEICHDDEPTSPEVIDEEPALATILPFKRSDR